MDHFEVVILTARPAAGKSEVIDYLKKAPDGERMRRFHVARLEEFDDFVYVWQTFEDDDIWEKLGRSRQNTDAKKYFKDDAIWNFYIHKINLAFAKKLAREPDWCHANTALVEFARGGENGIRDAMQNLSDDILKRAAVVYINVSYEESVRKNRKRARPGLEDSILYHSLPDEKMDFYYKVNDWEKLSGGKKDGFIEVKGQRVPFAVFDNEPERTDDPKKLGPALDDVFARLWKTARSGR
jgi:hypothetical protein